MSQQFQLHRELRVAVLTISDTRTYDTDRSGQMLRQLAVQAGVTVLASAICPDQIEHIQAQFNEWLYDDELDAIITTGGTGIAKRDVSIEAVRPLLQKEIEGFGELFRYLSYVEDVGTRALLSRSLAGIAADKVVFVLPGSTGAVKLAMEKLILPELEHLVFEATKHKR